MAKQIQQDFRLQEMFRKVEAYLSGDLTQQQFCESEGLAQSTFQYWLRKYRKVNNQGIVSCGDFVPVRLGWVNDHQMAAINCEIELSVRSRTFDSPGRMVIRFHSASLTSSLVNLIHSLVD